MPRRGVLRLLEDVQGTVETQGVVQVVLLEESIEELSFTGADKATIL